MAIVILPDAQADLLSLQAYMLDKWSEADWLKAEDEIFDKLTWVDTDVLAAHPCRSWHRLACSSTAKCSPRTTSWSTGVLTVTPSCTPLRGTDRTFPRC
jgi:hypothetical protein